MRFLHLSDLHLGKRVCEFSMLDDQRYILEQVLSLLDARPVDGVLLAGDLYDKPVPPAEAVRLLGLVPHRACGAGPARFLPSAATTTRQTASPSAHSFWQGAGCTSARSLPHHPRPSP